jgi:hypothetical protein
MRVRSNPFTFDLEIEGRTLPATICIEIRTHEARIRPENEAAVELTGKSRLLYAGIPSTGYPVGSRVLKAPEDTLSLSIQYQYAKQGDIDLSIESEVAEPVGVNALTRSLAPLLHGLQAYIHLATGDWLVAETPPQTAAAVGHGQRRFETEMRLAVQNRPCHNPEEVGHAMTCFAQARLQMESEEGRALDVALKRYLDGQIELDPIDQFCDYWEGCEFVTRHIRAKGNVVSRIATGLALHSEHSKPRLETALGLRELYEVRKDLVHNAVERAESLEQAIQRLADICRELIRWRLGLDYTKPESIETRLREAT